jgi:hypothetical protein
MNPQIYNPKRKPKGALKMDALTYSEVNGYRSPDLTLPQEDEVQLGKYGLLRRSYLKQHRKGLFAMLLMNGKLNAHLMEIEQTAQQSMETMVREMAAAQGVTEELKAQDQMLWVGRMNNIRHSAEEVILEELIHS